MVGLVSNARLLVMIDEMLISNLPLRRLGAALAILSSISLTACSSSDDDEAPTRILSETGRLSAEFQMLTDPPQVGDNQARLTFYDAQTHEPYEGLIFSVEPWMPHHDHGSSATPTVKDEGKGQYLVEDIVFTMPGSWDLRVHITSPFTDTLTPKVVVH